MLVSKDPREPTSTQPNFPLLMAIMMMMMMAMVRVMAMIKISVMMIVVLIVHRGGIANYCW